MQVVPPPARLLGELLTHHCGQSLMRCGLASHEAWNNVGFRVQTLKIRTLSPNRCMQVEPLLEVLAGQVLERALTEVLEEHELAELRARQAAYQQARVTRDSH